jgi:putative ABC transport system permease protein
VGLLGIDTSARLRQTVDLEGRVLQPAAHGMTLSMPLGRLLDVRVGDTVAMEFLDGERERRLVPVAGFVDDLMGTAAYVSIATWVALRDGNDGITGASLATVRGENAAVYAALKRLPAVRSVGSRSAMRASFDATVARSFGITLGSLLVFAAALCVGVVYNTARIALAERGRELASLRVLGFTRGEVASMLFGEQLILALGSLPVGAAIGAAFAWLTVQSMGTTELFRMPLVIGLRTYLSSFAVLAVAGVASAVVVRYRLDRLDLVAVLKTRE